jgi:hypothetical protein
MFGFDRPKIEISHTKKQVIKVKLNRFAKVCYLIVIILELNNLPCAALRAMLMRVFQSSCSFVNVAKSPIFHKKEILT